MVLSGPILIFKVWSALAWRVRGARAYNGALGAAPAGFRGRAPGHQGQSPWSVVKAVRPLKLKAFQRPIKAGKFTSFTVSSKLRVCDVSSTFNKILNISLPKTGFKVAEVTEKDMFRSRNNW